MCFGKFNANGFSHSFSSVLLHPEFAKLRLPFAVYPACPEPVEGSLSKKNDSKSTGWKGWSVRSYFDRLSTNGDRCRQCVPTKSMQTEIDVVDVRCSFFNPFALLRPEPVEGSLSKGKD
jgi:hypothetical protein